jgi:hypothetical protein
VELRAHANFEQHGQRIGKPRDGKSAQDFDRIFRVAQELARKEERKQENELSHNC